MLRLTVMAVLLISTFVGRVSPVLQKGEHETIKAELVANLTNVTGGLTNTGSKVIEPVTKPTDGKNENASKENISTSTKNPTTIDMVTPTSIEKFTKSTTENCTSTKESEDMLECNVTPTDDDDAIEKNSSTDATEPSVMTTVSNKAETKAETVVSNNSSQKDKDSDQEKGIVVVLNSTEAADKVSYNVGPTETDHSLTTTNSDVTSVDTKNDTKTSEVPIVPTPPLLVDKAAASIVTEDVGAVKSTDQGGNKRMPSGIIALVTAISFAVAIALVYIGMIVWRRYIEYRYGHRELLVNELEFDTNDLRHFEL